MISTKFIFYVLKEHHSFFRIFKKLLTTRAQIFIEDDAGKEI